MIQFHLLSTLNFFHEPSFCLFAALLLVFQLSFLALSWHSLLFPPPPPQFPTCRSFGRERTRNMIGNSNHHTTCLDSLSCLWHHPHCSPPSLQKELLHSSLAFSPHWQYFAATKTSRLSVELCTVPSLLVLHADPSIMVILSLGTSLPVGPTTDGEYLSAWRC